MAVITENIIIASGIYMMRVSGVASCGRAGQFFMLSTGNTFDPLLKRPISIFDCGEGSVTFVYRVAGRGTDLLSSMKAGDTINLLGPLGNGFMLEDANAAIVGGGIGIAPLYRLAKEHALRFPDRKRTIYLGYTDETFLLAEFSALCTDIIVNIGGYITDEINFKDIQAVYACGPDPMMRKLAEISPVPTFVSTEQRMACGVGACLGCTIKTASGNKRVCKDGPVFSADEVYYEQT